MNKAYWKLTAPDLPKIVERSDLQEKIRRARGRMIWISGPAGSGKTTLAAGYLQSTGRQGLWYNVDATDADPTNFFNNLAHYASDGEGMVAGVPEFSPEQQLVAANFSKRFFGALFDILDPPPLIIFDDVHEAGENAPMVDMILAGLTALPSNGRVIFISRRDIPAQMVRLRANRDLLGLGWADLKLTPGECTEIVRQHGHGARSPAIAKRLHQLVDGWAAGMILLLQDPDFIETAEHGGRPVVPGGRETLFTYFATEIMERLPARHRELLQRTALPSRFSAADAEALCGPSAREVLSNLYRGNALIERSATPKGHGHDSPWMYRYHPQFRDFLLQRLQKTESPDRLRLMRCNAAALAEAAGRLDEAADLLAQAEAWPKLIALCLGRAQWLLASGRQASLARWINLVPQNLREDDPWLLYFSGQCSVMTDHGAMRDFMARAHQRFTANADLLGMALSWAGVANAISFEWRDFSDGRAWADKAAAFADLDEGMVPPEALAEIGRARLDLLTACDPGDPATDTLAARQLQLLPLLRAPFQKMLVAASLVYFHVNRGEIRTIGAALDMFNVGNADIVGNPMLGGLYRTFFSVYLMAAGRLDEALETVGELEGLARDLDVPNWNFLIYGNKALIGFAWDDKGVYDAALSGLKANTDPNLPVAHALSLGFQSLRHMGTGHLDEARQLAHDARQILQQANAPYQEGWIVSFLAEIALAGDALEDARAYCRDLWQLAKRTRANLLTILAHLIEADIAAGCGETESMHAALQAGLAISRQTGSAINAPVTSRRLARLCALAISQGIEPDHARAVIKSRRLRPPPDLPDLSVTSQWPWPIRIQTLGQFTVLVDDDEVRSARKAQRKPMDLLKQLCIAKGEGRITDLCDVLWPDADGDSAHNVYKVTVSRLRKLLGDSRALIQRGGTLSLNPDLCQLDLWILDGLLRQRQISDREVSWLRSIQSNILLPGDEHLDGIEAAREYWNRRISRKLGREGDSAERL